MFVILALLGGRRRKFCLSLVEAFDGNKIETAIKEYWPSKPSKELEKMSPKSDISKFGVIKLSESEDRKYSRPFPAIPTSS
jgi:hypothetical protein